MAEELEFDPFEVEWVDPTQSMLTRAEIDNLIEVGRERLTTGQEATGGLWLNRDDPELGKRRMDGVSKYHQRVRKERIDRQGQMVARLAAGYSIEDCCWHVNITKGTYYKWRTDDEDFKRESTRAQREGKALLNGISTSNARELPFHILRKRCFGRDTYGYQQTMIDIIEEAPEGEITMILLPPGVGKTMTLEDWLSLELAMDQTKRCMYISESSDLGERTMSVIKDRFENTDGEYNELNGLFGPLYDEDSDKAWRQTAIRMPGAKVGNRDYSLRTRGMKSQIYSIRADIIILDDIQTRNTLGLTKKFLDDIRGTILTRREGAIQGKVIYIGTRLELNDLPSVLIKEGVVLEENLFIMPLINSEGRSNFEDVIPTKSLPVLVRQQGSMFQSVYQQNPAGATSNTFSDVVGKVRDPRYTLGTWHKAQDIASDDVDNKVLGRIVTIDPSLTGGNAIMAMGYSMTDLWVYGLDIKYNSNRMSYAEDMLEDFILRFQATELIIEDKAYQKALLTSERIEAICSKYGVKLRKHTTGTEKHDETFGVAKMETPMMQGHIHVPWGDDASQQEMGPLIEQLQMWRPDLPTKAIVQDAVMALWFGHHWIVHQRALAEARKRADLEISRSSARHGNRSNRRIPYGKTRMPGRH